MMTLLLHASAETAVGSALWFMAGIGTGAVLAGLFGHLVRR
jgi:hypothetical protein